MLPTLRLRDTEIKKYSLGNEAGLQSWYSLIQDYNRNRYKVLLVYAGRAANSTKKGKIDME